MDRRKMGRIFMAGFISLFFTSIIPFVLFAPIPLTFIFLREGRQMGIVAGVVLCVSALFLSHGGILPQYSGMLSILSLIFAVLLSEIFYKKIHPISGLFKYGSGMLAGFGLLFFVLSFQDGFSIKKEISDKVFDTMEILKKEKGDHLFQDKEHEKEFKEVLNNPQILADQLYAWLPAGLFVSTFLVLWLGIFFTLRGSLFWNSTLSYPHTIDKLIKFKVPDFFVWVLILALVLVLGGEYIVGEKGAFVGMNLLYCLGVFYFFQGFGVYLDFLSNLKILGFFRNLLIIFMVVMGLKILVLVGIFDYWMDFRRFFNKDNKKRNVL